MRLRRHRLALGGLLTAALLVALPVVSQQADAPESLLPEGLETAPPPPVESAEPVIAPVPDAPAAALAVPEEAEVAPSPFDLPAATGRSIDVAGPLRLDNGGYGTAAFTGSNGRFVAGVLYRLDTPVASRWAHIVLRRALLSESSAPGGIAPADWIAARARTLLAMGEVDGAVALVDAVPADRYSPSLYRVAGQAHLAAADIGGLCPLAQTGVAVSRDPLWKLLTGMCGAMSGDDLTSASVFDRLKGSDTLDPFDLQLAERVATLSGGGGRAANIEWETVPRLTPYRFGVAVAAGVRVPDARLAGMPPGWVLRAPGIGDTARLAAVRPAAALGIASAQELVSTIAATADDEGLAGSPASRLRSAYAAASLGDRYAALKAIRDEAKTPQARYAALLETALPAARLPVDKRRAAEAPDVIAALLGVGLEREALRWWRVLDGSDAVPRAWGLLASSGGVPVTPERFETWADGDNDEHRARLLLAGLDALGRTRGEGWAAVRTDLGLTPVSNSWTRALASAAARGSAGEVAVLAASGLQCDWRAVPPAHFGAIVAAYVRVGRAQEARLLVAEAVTRG
ncbi:hypothetical protein [Glacieibacterium frigidum]|uniref:hypothetical protein n=1 Tax=Glacieibacterium frigidum TaxID=2593303 RepID=UPI001F42BE3F|nr:hypothetical protein [Glacieibacterium frigidum]